MPDPSLQSAGIVDAHFGKGVTVVQPVNIYRCRIGSERFIGPFVEIQRGAVVGERCRIQSHSFIVSSSRSATTASTRIGNRVSIGTNATIPPVTICDDVVVRAGSVVTRNITTAGIYAGNAARKLRDAA